MTTLALVHDYLTQRGGAERIVLSMIRAFPDAPLYTSLYSPESTFEEFRHANIRPLALNRIELLRRNHRLAAVLLPMTFSMLTIDADVVLCSSSGWAHGVRATGRKIVYCFTPARWLYQADRYFRGRHLAMRAGAQALGPILKRWDQKAARSARRYLTQSTAVRERIRRLYGIDAEVLPGPISLGGNGSKAVAGLKPEYFLSVARLLPYKNVAAVVAAFHHLPRHRLAVVGTGPELGRLRRVAPRNVKFLGVVSDEELRWLYTHAAGLIAASYEDYGLTPLEAAAHGKPTAALRWGGYLDTVVEGETGIFFEAPTPVAISDAISKLASKRFDPLILQAHASRYSEETFIGRLRSVVANEMQLEPVEVGVNEQLALAGW